MSDDTKVDILDFYEKWKAQPENREEWVEELEDYLSQLKNIQDHAVIFEIMQDLETNEKDYYEKY